MDVALVSAIPQTATALLVSQARSHPRDSAVFLARREHLHPKLLPFLPQAALLVLLVNFQALLDRKPATPAALIGAPPSAASPPRLLPLLKLPST